MNIVNQLTLRQLKLNRKRTIVTIIGAIISAAMITAVSVLGISFMDLMQRQVIANDGEWHVLYGDVNTTQLDAIKKDSETASVIISRDTGYALLHGSQNLNKPYIFIKEYNPNGFEKFPVKLLQGRLPENPDEIVISEAISTNARVNYQIGDALTLDIGNRYSTMEMNKGEQLMQSTPLQKENGSMLENLSNEMTRSYSIVGIIERPDWEPTWSPGYTAISYVDESFIGNGETVNASVILMKVKPKLFQHAQNLASENGIQKVSFNDTLLRYYGVVAKDSIRNMLISLSVIIMAIIMVGSISMIYNAFAISVSERSRHLGMLSSVGATKKQKRNSVLFEGAIIGAISIPVGIVAGIAGIGITFSLINPLLRSALTVTEDLSVVASPASILAAVILSVVTIFLSTSIPARRASRLSAIDAIRQTADVKLTGREVKTSKLTRMLFGIEGDLALKNLKRSKRRYKATVFSLMISLVLFLVVSQFTQELKKSLSVSQTGVNFDIQVTLQSEDEENKEAIVAKILSLDSITSAVQTRSTQADSWIDAAAASDSMKNNANQEVQDGKYHYYVYINTLDDNALMAYAKEVGVDYEPLKNADNPAAIIIDTVKYEDPVDGRYVEEKVLNMRKGSRLPLNDYDWEKEEEIELPAVEVAALTDVAPMGIMRIMSTNSFNIVVSNDVFEKITENQPYDNQSTRVIVKTDDPMGLQQDIEDIQLTATDSELYVHNIFLARQREEQMILLMSVFTYGFIVLIIAICIANIINTISTSIALRKREFAMLKSVGMTPGSFGKMLRYESVFYGLKAILYGLPVSFVVMVLIHRVLGAKFSFMFMFPWVDVCIAIAAVFVIVGVTMLYSGSKLKQDNIIDVLKQEII